jgi:hypothetical protein
MRTARKADRRRRSNRRAFAASPCLIAGSGTARSIDPTIAAFRVAASNIASRLTLLSDEVRVLSSKVARLTRPGDDNPAAHASCVMALKDRSTALLAPARAEGAPNAIGEALGPRITQRTAWSTTLTGSQDTCSVSAVHKATRNPEEITGPLRPVVFDIRPLLVVSSTAVILLALFITAMSILEAAQPRIRTPTATYARRTLAPPTSSSLISPVPIRSQSSTPLIRDQAMAASASSDGQRRDVRTSDR